MIHERTEIRHPSVSDHHVVVVQEEVPEAHAHRLGDFHLVIQSALVPASHGAS